MRAFNAWEERNKGQLERLKFYIDAGQPKIAWEFAVYCLLSAYTGGKGGIGVCA